MQRTSSIVWPSIPFADWRETCATLHLWTQIVGKIRLAFTPAVNHSWHTPLYVTARGLTTSSIPFAPRTFDMTFDFIDHVLRIDVSDGSQRSIPLRPQSVADFRTLVLGALDELGIVVAINDLPCEIPGAIRFNEDHTHASYDADAAQRFWLALVQVTRVFQDFRSRFLGKVSPGQFFWGSFDLAVTRFSGRTAPPFAGKVPGVAIEVMRDAYSHEVSSAGFWPGGNGIDYAAFYSYAYPAPPGFRERPVKPSEAFFSEALQEFVLPYDAVRTAPDPDAALLSFLQTTYEAAAESAGWELAALEYHSRAPRRS